MAKATKLPSGNYRVQAYANGQRESFTAVTERKAIKLAEAWQEHQKLIACDFTNMTLKEAMQKYINDKDAVLSPSTIRGYDNIMRNHLQYIIDMQLNKLTQPLIQATINEEARDCSPKSIANRVGFLSAVLTEYYPDFKFKIRQPQKIPFVPNLPTTAQLGQLFQSLEGDTAEIYLLMAMWLGLRRSEILAVKWEDINFEKNVVYIHRAIVPDKNHKFVVKGTKTVSSTRFIKMPLYIINKLNNMPRASEYICTIAGDTGLKHLKRHCDKLGIPQFRVHDLRGVMASVADMLGISDKYIMQRGGWASDHVMKKVYINTFKDIKSENDDVLDNYFNDLIAHEISHK